jgi:hypothetical protein
LLSPAPEKVICALALLVEAKLIATDTVRMIASVDTTPEVFRIIAFLVLALNTLIVTLA